MKGLHLQDLRSMLVIKMCGYINKQTHIVYTVANSNISYCINVINVEYEWEENFVLGLLWKSFSQHEEDF